MDVISGNFKAILEQIFGEEEVRFLINRFNVQEENFDEWIKIQFRGCLQILYSDYQGKYVLAEHEMEQGKPCQYNLPYTEYLDLLTDNMNEVQKEINLLINQGSVKKWVLNKTFVLLEVFAKNDYQRIFGNPQ